MAVGLCCSYQRTIAARRYWIGDLHPAQREEGEMSRYWEGTRIPRCEVSVNDPGIQAEFNRLHNQRMDDLEIGMNHRELPFQTFERITGQKWPGGKSGKITMLLAIFGIWDPPGSADANLKLQQALLMVTR